MNWDKLTDKQYMLFAKGEYRSYKIGHPYRIGNDKFGYVQQRIGFNKDGSPNASHAGEQAYVVTNTRNPHKATEVAVVYRGSDTDFDHHFKDSFDDWVMNDAAAAGQIKDNNPNEHQYSGNITVKATPPQFKAAAKTLDSVCRKYPHAAIYVFGHSLGSMDGQYGLCRTKYPYRIKRAYLYEGPNIYHLLTPAERRQARELRHRIYNYHDGKDLISFGYDHGKKYIGRLICVNSARAANFIDQHMWRGYRFDRHGNLKKGGRYAGMDEKKVKVDPGDVVAIANVLTAAVEEALTVATSEVKREKSFFEENWQHVQQMARAIGTDLSMGEIMDALAAGGATQASMVAQPQEICEQELHQLVSAAERLTSLGSGMRSAAGNFEATDSKISQMIGE